MWSERLEEHLRQRPERLDEYRKQGKKVVGSFPGNYVPEELIVAAGAAPVCLVNASGVPQLEASLTVMPNVFCPFARTLVGEKLLRTNPYYRVLDMLVAPITCQHVKKAAEIWECHQDIELFKLGVPHQHNYDFEQQYFQDRLGALKDRLEAVTGNRITDTSIGKAIELYNRMRGLLNKIGELRLAPSPPLSILEFVRLNHASFYADPEFMVEVLDQACEELSQRTGSRDTDKPRLMLIAPNVGLGDYRMLEMVGEAGGDIVIEEIYEGVRNYRQTVDINGEPMHALAVSYLNDRVPPAFMRYSAGKRLDFVLNMIREYRVSGVIWYELLCCETYDSESYFFLRELEDRKIPMLILESDYGTTDAGQIRTRLEAFIEIVKGELVW